METLTYDSRRTLAVRGTRDGRLEVYDARSGTRLSELAAADGPLTQLRLAPSGDRLLTATTNGPPIVWDWPGLTELGPLPGHEAPITAMEIGPDGTMVSADSQGRVILWDADARELRRIELGRQAVRDLALSPDGRLIAIVSRRGPRDSNAAHRVALYGTDDGELDALLLRSDRAIHAAAFHPEGTRLAVASADGSVRIFDAATRAPLLFLEGHGAAVLDVAFSQDGDRLFSAARDRTVRAWVTASDLLLSTVNPQPPVTEP